MRLAFVFLVLALCIYTTSGFGIEKDIKIMKFIIAKVGPKLKAHGLMGKSMGCCKAKGFLKMLKLKHGCKGSKLLSLFRKKRSVTQMVNRVFETVSNGLQSAGGRLKNFGDTISNASLTTRVAGLVASDRLRTGATNLLNSTTSGEAGMLNDVVRNLIRRRRAAPKVPQNFVMPSGKMTLEGMFAFVKQHRAQICVQRVICELSANSAIYGEEGIRFGTKLLACNNSTHREADQYKRASKVGNKLRGKPESCEKKYPKYKCNYDSRQLIAVGNSILQ